MSARTAAQRRHHHLKGRIDELDLEPQAVRSLPQLARAVESSPRTLQRVLPAGFSVWRRQYMLSWSLQALAKGETVGAVALGAGYSSPGAFSFAFKELMGISPSDARRAFRATTWLVATRDWDTVFADPSQAHRWSRKDTRSAVALLDIWHGGHLTELGKFVLAEITPEVVQTWVQDARIRLFDSPDEVAVRDGWTDPDGRFRSEKERYELWIQRLPRGDASAALDQARRLAAHANLKGKERALMLAYFDGATLQQLASGRPGSTVRTEARFNRAIGRLIPVVTPTFHLWSVAVIQ